MPAGCSVDLPFLHHTSAISSPHIPRKHLADEHRETWHFLTGPGKQLSGTQQITLCSRNVVWAPYEIHIWLRLSDVLDTCCILTNHVLSLPDHREEHLVCSPVSAVPRSSGAPSGHTCSQPQPSPHMSLQTGPWCCLGFP